MKTILILNLLLINIISSFSINFNEYINLNISNVFVYNSIHWVATPPYYNCSGNYLFKVTITDTVRYDGKKYYYYTKQIVQISGTCSFTTFMFPFNVGNYNTIRLDSVNGMIYYYNPGNGCYYSPNETMIDSLNSNLNDTVTIRCVPSPYFYPCVDTINKKRYYNIGWGSQGEIRRQYTRGVGLTENYNYYLMSGFSRRHEQYLVGRVINGIVYGDTSFPVGVNKIGTEVPSQFSLSQNYPNPFNPNSKIKFQIAKLSEAKLVVYDVLGREIQPLVNEELKPGTYEVDFDGTNLPSGIYYYTLTAGDFLETKKMVLIK